MDNYRIIKPEAAGSFAEAQESVLGQLEAYLADEAAAGRAPVLIKFFLSDAQNQIGRLSGAFLAEPSFGEDRNDAGSRGGVVSFVEQPPLDGCRIAALAWTSSEAEKYTFQSIRLTEEEAAGKDSYEQTRLLFSKYLDIIKPQGLELKTHCIRTWIYVRDIDSNYAGMVRARNEVFAEEGLTDHYIASTGIGGATEGRNALVAMDFLTCPGIREDDKTYLKALSHLSPTRDYGVAFERGVKVAFGLPDGAGHIFISGTASIDHRGHILHEGDVLAQTDRLLENIDALMAEGGQAGSESVLRPGNARTGGPLRATIWAPRKSADFWGRLDGPFARRGRQTGLAVPYLLIYLRDISDYAKVEAYMQTRYPDIPRIILEARVCRPGWLIEMECESSVAE